MNYQKRKIIIIIYIVILIISLSIYSFYNIDFNQIQRNREYGSDLLSIASRVFSSSFDYLLIPFLILALLQITSIKIWNITSFKSLSIRIFTQGISFILYFITTLVLLSITSSWLSSQKELVTWNITDKFKFLEIVPVIIALLKDYSFILFMSLLLFQFIAIKIWDATSLKIIRIRIFIQVILLILYFLISLIILSIVLWNSANQPVTGGPL